MKPVACGNQMYSTGTFSSAATISAILFSKPSPLSLENGMLAGSPHTRKDKRLTRSTRLPSAASAAGASSTARAAVSSAATLLLLPTKADLLMFFGRRGLLSALGGTATWQAALGPRLEVNVDIVDVAH